MELVIASGKGGVGKSTIISSLASLLINKQFAIVDADAEAPNLHLLLGVKQWDKIIEYHGAAVATIEYAKCTRCMVCKDVCVYNAITIKHTDPYIRKYLCEGCGACKIVCPAHAIEIEKDLFAGWIRIANTSYGPFVSAELDVGQHNSGKLVSEEKKIARVWLRENTVKNILVDSAAGIGCQVIASLSGAKKGILVAEPTEASFSDLMRVYTVAEHFRIKSYLVINKYDLNPEFDKFKKFANDTGVEIISKIPYDLAVNRSLVSSVPVVELEPDAKVSKAIRELSEIVRLWLD